jgi:predicted amidohydrolase YtcJ
MAERDGAAVPDLIVLSERIVTMDPDGGAPRDGIVVSDGRITGFVARDEVERLRGEQTQVVDVGHRTLMPGFVDPHAHAEDVCRDAFLTVDCRAPECRSVEDVLEVLADAAAKTEPGGWIIGQGNLFFDRKLADGRFPSREELDRVTRRHPVAIRAGGHLSMLNSRGLEDSGIDRGYVPPQGSLAGTPVVDRDADGEPTGVVKEMDSILPFPTLAGEEIATALRRGLQAKWTANGVTTIGEISCSEEGIRIMDGLAAADELPVRMRVYLWAPGTISFERAIAWRRELPLQADPAAMTIQGLKLFADGGFSSRNAAVKCPYVGTHSHGNVALDADDVVRALDATRDAGLQLAIHANGDRAQEWLCEVIAGAGGAPAGPLRTRIEHAGNFVPDQAATDLWREAGIIPVPQPVFLYNFGDYFADYLGSYGERGRFPFRTLLDDGWRLSASSDVWVGAEREQTNPLFSVWCCMARRSFAGRVIDEHEAITIDEALRMHTLDAASVLGEDDVKGSLTPGKLADMIVLDRDPRTAAVDDLRGLRVEQTYVGGRRVDDGTPPEGRA